MQTHVVAKSLVFNKDHQVLLLRRASHDAYRPGGIDLPGGKVEEGEEIATGALREVLEETGLTIDPATMQLVYSLTKAGDNTSAREAANIVRLFFICQTDGSDVKVNPEEHDTFYWYPIQEAVEKTDHPIHKELLAYIQKHNLVPEAWGGV
jgi:8-oxo-dGTP diphosphatase